MSKLLMSMGEVHKYLLRDEKCSKENLLEVLSTLENIDANVGRKWIFTPEEKKYYIDEYNEHNDLVKTVIIRL